MGEENSQEQSFNDDELADIMSEIESLESELVEEDGDLAQIVSNEEVSSPVEEIKPSTEEVELKAVPVTEEIEQVVESAVPKQSNPETTLNFDVTGNMKFNLGFIIDGKTLSVYVDSKSEELVIEMDGGVKLNVPFNGLSKAA